MYINDPHGEWEKEWTAENPEPVIIYERCDDGTLHGEWSTVVAHIDWLDRRWMAYRKLCDECGWQTRRGNEPG